MKKNIIIITFSLIILLTGCGKKEKLVSKNMDQIYAEEGIPVTLKSMTAEMFVKKLPFTSTLSGIRQSMASAMVGGRIDKILVNTGDYVEKDQVIIEFPEDVPSGQYIQAKAAFDLSESTYQRMKNLYDVGGISLQDLDQTEAQFKVAEANFDAVKQMLKVRAPISGYVSDIAVRETDNVKAETALATIANTNKLKAKIWVTESEICQIKKGAISKATWNNVELFGVVTQVGMTMSRQHNAFGIDLEFDNKDNICKSGVIAEIAITVYENSSAFLIPRQVLKKDTKGVYVFVSKDNKAVKQYIKTGQENGQIEVIEGLQKGDKLIISSLNLVQENSKLNEVK